MAFISKYMVPTFERGYHGFRALPEFESGPMRITSDNPSRPTNYALSIIYTDSKVPGYEDAVTEAHKVNKFPGQHM